MEPTDRQLLAAAADAFGELYRRHVRSMLAFFVWRTGDAEVAADLTAESFAAALAGVRSYRGEAEPAAWLYGIARRKLALSRRRGRVDDAVRAALAMCRLEL